MLHDIWALRPPGSIYLINEEDWKIPASGFFKLSQFILLPFPVAVLRPRIA